VPSTLRTARLLLTPVEDNDLGRLHAHWNDPQVGRWLWDGKAVDLQTVAGLVDRSTRTFQDAGWGLWALRTAAGAPLIGVCGLCPFEQPPGGVELLYSLDPTYWSRGLATEAATAVLTHAFDTLGLAEVVATTDDGNQASLRLLERLGAVPTTRARIGDQTHPCFRIHPPTTQIDPGLLPPGPRSSTDRATDF
jgi:[ribosomal protein S5]-alanine N-acetyltransferase